MCIDVADPQTEQPLAFDHLMDLVVIGDASGGKIAQIVDQATVPQISKRKLPCDKGVNEHNALLQRCREGRIAVVEVIDPHGSIDQQHARSPAPWGRLELRLAAAETGEAQCAFTLNQRFQPFPHQCGLFLQAGQRPGLGKEIFVQRNGGSHGQGHLNLQHQI